MPLATNGTEEGVRLAAVLQVIAAAGELGMGQPPGHVLRTCLIALRIAEEMGLPEPQRQAVYGTALLVHGGCTAGGALFASYVACDELKAKREMCLCDPDSVVDVLRWVRSNVAAGDPLPARVQKVLAFLASAEPTMGDIERGCADVGARVAARLSASPDVVRSLDCVCERWNGKGARRKKGAQIPLPARIAPVAMVADVFLRERGRDAVVDAVRSRSGSSFDPDVVKALVAVAKTSAFWDGLDAPVATLAARVLDAEPGDRQTLSADRLDDVALAIADFVDVKAGNGAAHARATAALCERAARALGVAGDDLALLRRAALLHDIGMIGVPSFVLAKPAHAQSMVEREQVALHVAFTERLLAPLAVFAPVVAVARRHHERSDAATREQTPTTARILAVCDAYDEAIRAGADRDSALQALGNDAGLDGVCVRALASALADDARTAAAERAPPAGLTTREVDVLRLVAAGLTVKEAAAKLFVSPHTARHHLEHAYAKIGVTSRAGAVLFAIEHGLVER